ncbi:mini-chromosome maintenance complex-binding protein [Salmo salar]|uniref:Mini-chromosome maintenance complex-binding protein n=1 Tax=Salmo salar TaxID=8030 RepID=A0ABM3EVN6_SALSA|nr:mini-chromosome maintenance complex-binding protein-like [Salmo salar]
MEIWPCGNTNPIKVPLLNDVPLHYLKHNSLVKFRCLVQDIFDPEFYMGVYETVDPSPKANVYEDLDSFILNDTLEVFVILSINPHRAPAVAARPHRLWRLQRNREPTTF